MQNNDTETESDSDESLDDCLQKMSGDLNMGHFLKNLEQLGGQTAKRNENVIKERKKDELLRENLSKLRQRSDLFGNIRQSMGESQKTMNGVEFDTVGMRTEEIKEMRELCQSKDTKETLKYLQRLNGNMVKKLKRAYERPEPKMKKKEFDKFYDRIQITQERSRSRLEEKRRKWKKIEGREETFKPRLNRRSVSRSRSKLKVGQEKRNLAEKLMREDSLDKFEECTIRSRSVSAKEDDIFMRQMERKMERLEKQTRDIMEKKKRKRVENEIRKKMEEERRFKEHCTFQPRVNKSKKYKSKIPSTLDRLYEWKKKNEQKLEEQRKYKEKKFREKHTFKPKLKKSVYNDRKYADSGLEQVGERLYNDHIVKMKRKRISNKSKTRTMGKGKKNVKTVELNTDSEEERTRDRIDKVMNKKPSKSPNQTKDKAIDQFGWNTIEDIQDNNKEFETGESRRTRKLTAYRSDFGKGRAVRNDGVKKERVELSRSFNRNKEDKLRETIELLNENWEEVDKDTKNIQEGGGEPGYGDIYQKRVANMKSIKRDRKKSIPKQSLQRLKMKKQEKENRKRKKSNSQKRVYIEAEVSYEEGRVEYRVKMILTNRM